MILDLKGEENMEPIVGMLFSMVKDNFNRLKSLVSDMSQEELDYKGHNQEYNSTAQLIRHLAFVDLNWVYRMKSELLPIDLEEKYGPMLDKNNQIPPIQGISVQSLLAEYDEVYELLKSTCCELSDQDLEYIVEYENGKKATINWGIWHIADHNRYHQAHINQLRKWYQNG